MLYDIFESNFSNTKQVNCVYLMDLAYHSTSQLPGLSLSGT